MLDVFMSYKREDKAKVGLIVQRLQEWGWSVFWDPNISPGERWDSIVESKLHEAKCVCVAWSTKSRTSAWVKDEAAYGRDKGTMIPILIEDVKPPLGFQQFQCLDLVAWKGEGPTKPEGANLVALKASL